MELDRELEEGLESYEEENDE